MSDEVGRVVFNVEVNGDEAQEDLKRTSQAIDQVGESAEDADKKSKGAFEGIKAKTLIMAAAIGKAMVEVGKFAWNAFKEFEDGKATIANATGASGDALKEFVSIAKDVYADTERGFDEISSALGEINTRFGYTGETLRKTTKMFADFADATGGDVTDSVKILSQAMNQWDVSAADMESLMDKLVVAGQKVGGSAQEYGQALIDNAATFKTFGYSLDESISMLMTFQKTGVSTSEVLMGMKKSFADSAAAGRDARSDWEHLMDTIINCTDETEANKVAIEVFGARVAGDLVQNLRSGKVSFDEYTAAIEDSRGALAETDKAGESVKDDVVHLKAELQKTAMAIMEELLPPLVELAPNLIDTAQSISKILVPAFRILNPVIEAAVWLLDKLSSGIGWVCDKINIFKKEAEEAERVAHSMADEAIANAEAQRQNAESVSEVNARYREYMRTIPTLHEKLEKLRKVQAEINTVQDQGSDYARELYNEEERLIQAVQELGVKTDDINGLLVYEEKNYRAVTVATANDTGAIKDNAKASEDAAKSKDKLKEKTNDLLKQIKKETLGISDSEDAIKSKRDTLQEALNEQLISQEEYNLGVAMLNEEQLANEEMTNEKYQELIDARKEALKAMYDAGKMSAEEYNAAVAKADEDMNKKIQQNAEATKQKRIQTAQEALSVIQQGFNTIMSLVNLVYDTELNKVEATYAKEKKALQDKLNKGEISYEEYEDALAALDEDYAKEKDEIGRKQFNANKATQIANAVINGAQAALQCFAQLGPIAGGIMAAVIAGTTAAQIALIAKQQYISSYAIGSDYVPDDRIAKVHRGEAILPAPDAQKYRDWGGMYGIESALSQPMASSGVLNTFNLNNQMNAVIEIDGTQLGIAVLRNIDNARQFVY